MTFRLPYSYFDVPQRWQDSAKSSRIRRKWRGSAEALEARCLLAVFPSFTPLAPLGSAIHGSEIEDAIETAGVADVHEISLPAGRLVSLSVQPAADTLQVRAELRDTQGQLVVSGQTSAAGEELSLSNFAVPGSGTYRLFVQGDNGTLGNYSAEFLLDTNLEATDSSAAAPTDIPFAPSILGVQRASIRGKLEPASTQVVAFSENFDGTTTGFTFDNTFGSGNGLWHLSTGRSEDGLPGHTGPGSLYFGRNETPTSGGDYSVGSTGGAVISPAIAIPASGTYELLFSHFLQTEGDVNWDRVSVAIDVGVGFVDVATSATGTLPTGTQGAWEQVSIDLSAYSDQTIRIRFAFDTIDGAANVFEGWFIDDVRVVAEGFASEEDVFSINLSQAVGQSMDVLFVGEADVDFSSATLQLLSADGSTVLATGSADPLGMPATNLTRGILDFVVPSSGLYRLRVTGAIPGEYTLLMVIGATFDVESNDDLLSEVRNLNVNLAALGYAEAQLATGPVIQPGELRFPIGSLSAENRWMNTVGTVSQLAYLPHGVNPADFAETYHPRAMRPTGAAGNASHQVEQIAVPEAEPNNSFGSGQLLKLGFDAGLGESTTIDVAGRLGNTSTTIQVQEPDGSIPLAKATGLARFETVRADGRIDPAQPATGDYDFYEVPNVAAGSRIVVNAVRRGTSMLDSALGIYNSSGVLVASVDDPGQLDSYLNYLVTVPGSYYAVVRGAGTNTGFQSDPFDVNSGLGIGSSGNYTVTIGVDVEDVEDYFRVPLEAGDVLAAGLSGQAGVLQFFNANEDLLMQVSNDQNFSAIFPASSPLRGIGASADNLVTWVVDRTGDYYLKVSGGLGNYDLNLGVFRPPLEAESEIQKQILFLDFDGADYNAMSLGGNADARLSPLRSFLPNWGLHPFGDYDAVIDAIVEVVEENLSHDPRTLGNNGDFQQTGIFGNFDIEIRNSRDHADPFGQPNVSRLIIGGTIPELGIGTIGIAETIDVGNFDTTETAIVLLDLLSAPGSNPNSLNQFNIAPSKSIIDLIGVGVGNIAAHEAGHFFGNWHTDQFNPTPNIMDQGGYLENIIGLVGAVWGDANDKDVDFGVDAFVPNEGFVGNENTLDVISFGLPRGGVVRGPSVQTVNPAAGIVTNLYVDKIHIQFSKALHPASATNAGNYRLTYAGIDNVFGNADDVQIGTIPVFNGDDEVTLDLNTALLPLPIGSYRLELLSSILDTNLNRLNARASTPNGSDTVHLFRIALRRSAICTA